MTHHQPELPRHRRPGDYSRPKRYARGAAALFFVPALAMTAVAFLPGALTDTEPSPTLTITTPDPSEPPRDYSSGGLASAESTPSPTPPQRRTVPQPAVMYEPAPTTVVVPPPPPRVIYVPEPPQPPATVVQPVPVPVQSEQPRSEHKPDEKRDRDGKHDRGRPEKTSTTPEPDVETTTPRSGCITGLVCRRDDGQAPKSTETRDRDRGHDQQGHSKTSDANDEVAR